MATKKKVTRKPKATGKATNGVPDSLLSGSEAIRRVIKQGITKTPEIVEKVKEEYKQDVKPGLVAAVKQRQGATTKRRTSSGAKRGRPKGSTAGKNGSTKGSDGIAAIEAAAAFIKATGGIEKAKRVLEAFASVQS